MNSLPPLNVNVTLHLMKFVSPSDGFNLALSGALGGVKNANDPKSIAKSFRFPVVGLEFGNHPDNSCLIDVKSLRINGPFSKKGDEKAAPLVLYRFLKEEIALNIRVLDLSTCHWLDGQRLRPVIKRMNRLEELYIHGTPFSLDDLARVFQACANVTRLSISLEFKTWPGFYSHKVWMKVLKEGFKKLKYFKVAKTTQQLYFQVFIIGHLIKWCGDSTELEFDQIRFCHSDECETYGVAMKLLMLLKQSADVYFTKRYSSVGAMKEHIIEDEGCSCFSTLISLFGESPPFERIFSFPDSRSDDYLDYDSDVYYGYDSHGF